MRENITLEARKERQDKSIATHKNRIVVCAGTGCVASGAMRIYDKLIEAAGSRGLDIAITMEKEEGAENSLTLSGCQGFCQMGPLITIYPQHILYVKVSPEDVDEIIDRTIVKGEIIDRLVFIHPASGKHIPRVEDIPFYALQHRLTLGLSGSLDVYNIDDYISHGGYFMARKAVFDMDAKEICDEILASGLRGRGGAGFPTGRKWDLTRPNVSDVKYVICNGDEGDPGAFMDRCVLEGNPHAVLEGMIIAAQAILATEGVIYVRMEYPLAVERLKLAIAAAKEAGILGDDIFGSGKRFDITIMEGAGAFVCGEETALIASVEGKRGMPTLRPPFPAQKGLFGKPTAINNVETLASVPMIMRMGAKAYSELGSEDSKGTKTFALTGHVANTGLIEVPFGTTLREIVGEIGGGVTDDDGNLCGTDFKSVQIGGPSGGCLTQEHIDMPLDYSHLTAAGAMVGSGGLVVMNQNTCMVKIARYFMQFTQNESCGKCVPCREGTRQLLSLLDDIVEGKATLETLELLETLAAGVKAGSLCALGKTAPNPVLSTLRFFRDEYITHVVDKKCPTGNCEALRTYIVLPDLCKSCGLCLRQCPVGAVSGSKGVPYTIDNEICVKCGVCMDACKFDAIVIE